MKERTGAVTDSSSTAVSEWRSRLTALAAAGLLFETLTGFGIYLLPFGRVVQFSVLVHTLPEVAVLAPLAWDAVRHWWVRRKGNPDCCSREVVLDGGGVNGLTMRPTR